MRAVSQNNIIKTLINLTFIVVITTIFTGCSFFSPYKAPITQGTVINQEALDTLQAGLTPAQVRQILGPPLGQDPFYPKHWEYVFYTTDKKFHPDAAKHLIVRFDEEFYLSSWTIEDKEVIIRRD